jgi:hypothetical protein
MRVCKDNTDCVHTNESIYLGSLDSKLFCFHDPCRVTHEFQDGSVWVKNKSGNVRRLTPKVMSPPPLGGA